MSGAQRHHLTSRATKPHLRGQTSRHGSRSSQGRERSHTGQRPQVGADCRSSPSSQAVLDGVGECVAQVQRACHVGGWDAHHEDPSGIWC